MYLNRFNNIIWDWNGTLLNDVDMCVKCMNQLLEPRKIPLLTKEIYRDVFTFPVQNYYQKIGIDFIKDPFDIIGHDFMDLYFEALSGCKLFAEAEEVLKHFQQLDKKQFILSAMEHESLKKSLFDYGISQYFDGVYGIDNHLAAGKTQRAIQLMSENNIESKKTILIGDTLHDLDVGNDLNIKTLLIANGHQSKSKLNNAGILVLDSLSELLEYIS